MGALVIGLVARLGWTPLRQVPASMRPHFDGFTGRLHDRHFVQACLLVAAALVMVGTTVLPAAIARWFAALLVLAVVGGFAAWWLDGILGLGLLAGRGARGALRLVGRRR